MQAAKKKTGYWQFAAGMALVCASSAGCAAGGGTAPVDPAPVPAAAMETCNRTPDGCESGAAFSLATLRDLSIRVAWSNLSPGTHTQTLEVLEPGGGLFEAKTQSFVIAEGPAGTATTEEILPVAGTWLTERGQTGAWKLRIAIDTTPVLTRTVNLGR